MPIKFTCPHCSSLMTVPDSLAGKAGKCSKCKGIVTVPALAGAPTASAPPASAPNPAPPSSSPTPATPRLAPDRPVPAKTSPIPPPRAPHPESTPPGATTIPTRAAETPTEAPPATSNGEAPPDRTLAEIEAEAASLLADAPKEEVEATTIDFTCDYCGEPVQLPIDVAGKKHPCPHCRRILRVPLPQKQQKKDWRNLPTGLPSGARLPDQPAPEGAWGTATKSGPSAGTLQELGLMQKKVHPRTFLQKFGLPLLAGTTLAVLATAGWVTWGWMAGKREEQALRAALDYAGSPKALEQVKHAGVAALYSEAGRYDIRTRRTGSTDRAREHLAKATSTALQGSGSERDALLGEVALALVELGGEGPETQDGMKLNWNEVQKSTRAALAGIASGEARLDAFQRVSARLIEKGQGSRVLPLAAQVFTAVADQAEAGGRAGVEMLAAGKKEDAIKVQEQVAAAFAKKKDPPPLRPAVVALAVALDRPPPSEGKGLEEKENNLIGQAAGKAAKGQWQEARDIADKAPSTDAKCRARAVIADQAVRAGSPEAKTDVEAALQAAAEDSDRKGLSWVMLGLVHQGVKVGLSEADLQKQTSIIPNAGVRAWAQLVLLRAKLSAARGVVEPSALESVEAGSLAALLARLELARHNTRADSAWASKVQEWKEEPEKAFGQMGVALGLQKD